MDLPNPVNTEVSTELVKLRKKKEKEETTWRLTLVTLTINLKILIIFMKYLKNAVLKFKDYKRFFI